MKNKKFAIYISDGVTSSTINVWLSLYKKGLIKDLSVLKSSDFVSDTLKTYDCVILPGGSGSKMCNRLDWVGRQALLNYINGGGRVLGVCAGAYALSCGYEWSMGVINYELIDKQHAHRGEKHMSFKVTEKGKKLLKIKDDLLPDIYYHNGPVWKKFVEEFQANENILMTFTEDIYTEGGTAGQAIGTPAVIHTAYGSGHVVAISPHFEKSPGYEYVIRKVLQFLTKTKN
jgi:glutamine amidotransferase-like uncharacterized protein